MTKKRRRISVKVPFKDPDFLSYGITEPELDRFLKSFEDWALGILVEGKHKYGADLPDLWRMIKGNDSRIDERARHAASLLDSALRLRDSIEANKAEQAAMSMLELVSCAIGIYMDEKKESSSNGGKASKKNEGLILIILEALKKSKDKAVSDLWNYVKLKYRGGEELNSKYGTVFFIDMDDPYWKFFKADGILITKKKRIKGRYLDITKENFVPYSTFKRYVMEAKKSLPDHSTPIEEIL